MAKLISVNVGLPHDVEWQGRTVRTAIWKEPVSRRIMARRLNLDGDGQGDLEGHGGEHRAIMVYQLESYRYWEQLLNRAPFKYGEFGENFTVDGLADNEVCVGDRYRIGGALLEVTQPRVTCYRVGIRMSEPKMPSLLVSHKRPGFYLRVLEEGEVGAGDEIIKVTDGPGGVTIREIDGLLYLPGHPREVLERALGVPALSSGWRQSLEAMVATAETIGHEGNLGLAPSSAPPPAWHGFRPLQVADIRSESFDVLSFIFQAEDGSALPAPIPGQFLVLKLSPDKAAWPIVRNYSVSGLLASGRYRISVKRGSGEGSRFLHDHVKIGDIIQVSAPRGGFLLVPSTRPIVLLGAGIGVTPLLAMLRSIAAVPESAARCIWWCYGARNGKEHPFATEVANLINRLPMSRSFISYSEPAAGDQGYDASGHLDLASLQGKGLPRDADFYVCGPSSFIEKFSDQLRAWGIASERIHSEQFSSQGGLTPGIAAKTNATPHDPIGPCGAGPIVTFTRSGLIVPWNSRYGSLLEFAEACDVPVKWSCRVGVCHTCETGLVDGQVVYATEPLDLPASGDVLICCSSPLTAIELDL